MPNLGIGRSRPPPPLDHGFSGDGPRGGVMDDGSVSFGRTPPYMSLLRQITLCPDFVTVSRLWSVHRRLRLRSYTSPSRLLAGWTSARPASRGGATQVTTSLRQSAVGMTLCTVTVSTLRRCHCEHSARRYRECSVHLHCECSPSALRTITLSRRHRECSTRRHRLIE